MECKIEYNRQFENVKEDDLLEGTEPKHKTYISITGEDKATAENIVTKVNTTLAARMK